MKIKLIPIQELESLYHLAFTVNKNVQAIAHVSKNSSNIAVSRANIDMDKTTLGVS